MSPPSEPTISFGPEFARSSICAYVHPSRIYVGRDSHLFSTMSHVQTTEADRAKYNITLPLLGSRDRQNKNEHMTHPVARSFLTTMVLPPLIGDKEGRYRVHVVGNCGTPPLDRLACRTPINFLSPQERAREVPAFSLLTEDPYAIHFFPL